MGPGLMPCLLTARPGIQLPPAVPQTQTSPLDLLPPKEASSLQVIT